MSQNRFHPQSEGVIPVYLFSGFLGSGKTTLVNQVIDYYKAAGVKAAIIMNELGEVNIEGQLVENDVPMAELLGGCICCTIRGDLSMEMMQLIEEHRPEVILIESTGAANPLEIIDGITETAMYAHVDLRAIVTVVDGPELLVRSRRGGRTFKLMQDQIRCATDLIVNKADKLAPEDLVEVQQLIREINGYAPLTVTIRCVTEMDIFDLSERPESNSGQTVLQERGEHICGANCSHDHDHHAADEPHAVTHAHDSHQHVMTLTHYLAGPINSESFEALIAALPAEVYRAKGIVTFSDTNSRFLFQYAYRESEFIRITPQGKVNDVVVFIGEHFAKEELQIKLHDLEEDRSL